MRLTIFLTAYLLLVEFFLSLRCFCGVDGDLVDTREGGDAFKVCVI